MAPPERVQPSDVEQLSRCAVGLRRIEGDRHARRDQIADALRELTNRQVLARADIDVLIAVVALEQEQTRVGQIVDVEEFTSWPSGAPDRRTSAPASFAS